MDVDVVRCRRRQSFVGVGCCSGDKPSGWRLEWRVVRGVRLVTFHSLVFENRHRSHFTQLRKRSAPKREFQKVRL
jgi:hypothetical protein